MAGRRLKVFQAQFGFYDTVVAAPSQAAAMRAWGIHQNLFASGQARISEDPQAIRAALANPEIPLKRAVSSDEPFALAPTSLPSVPDRPKIKRVGKTVGRPRGELAPARQPPADRSSLEAAEAALRDLDESQKRKEADFRQAAEALEARRMAAQSAYADARKAATSDIVDARKAYRKAGGED